jgi:hypothetical protein
MHFPIRFFLLILAFSTAARGDILPTRKATIVIPLLKSISAKDNYSEIEKILGTPDSDIGSGIYIFSFKLDDGSMIYVSTSNKKTISGISLKTSTGSSSLLNAEQDATANP